MVQIVQYEAAYREQWDDFVRGSKNGTFLFERAYMEYHANRFTDHSLLFFEKERLVALLPANEAEGTLHSHQGLTYGGLILNTKATAEQVLSLFEELLSYLRNKGFTHFRYKCVPRIYQRYPADEDRYALFRHAAIQVACNLSSTIPMGNPLRFAELRRRGIKKAVKANLRVVECSEFAPFWEVLSSNLTSRYAVAPVHTVAEITYLHAHFPEQIRLFTTIDEAGEVLAGCVVFDTPEVAHAQYISASPQGKACGALDLLFDQLINTTFVAKRWFDFGQSTEEMGHYLNTGLISQKEGFGGRGVVYEIFEITL